MPSKPGDFTAYLEYMKRSKEDRSAAPVSPIALLGILARQPQRAMAMADLEKLSEMDPSQFRNALKSLNEKSYIQLSGSTLEAVVTLTEKGAEASGLDRAT